MALPTDLTELLREKDQLERDACAGSLATFVRRGWLVLEPGTPYVHGRVIDIICEHLQAVTAGQIKRPLVTGPPRRGQAVLCGGLFGGGGGGPQGPGPPPAPWLPLNPPAVPP